MGTLTIPQSFVEFVPTVPVETHSLSGESINPPRTCPLPIPTSPSQSSFLTLYSVTPKPHLPSPYLPHLRFTGDGQRCLSPIRPLRLEPSSPKPPSPLFSPHRTTGLFTPLWTQLTPRCPSEGPSTCRTETSHRSEENLL